MKKFQAIQYALALFSQITKAEVDQFRAGLAIPGCLLELQWTGGGKTKPLAYRVKLRGARPPKDFFYMCYNPQAVGMGTADGKGKCCQISVRRSLCLILLVCLHVMYLIVLTLPTC